MLRSYGLGRLMNPRRIPLTLGAAAGAFGVAAMMSGATAPTARADAFTDIINAVDGDFTAGQTAFTAAFADFGSNHLALGLAPFFEGVNDDFLSAPDNLLIGTVEALTNEPVFGSNPWNPFNLPADFADALSTAQILISDGEGGISLAATDLAGGNFGGAAFDVLVGFNFTVASLEEILLGVAVG